MRCPIARWIAFDGRELHLTEAWDGPERPLRCMIHTDRCLSAPGKWGLRAKRFSAKPFCPTVLVLDLLY